MRLARGGFSLLELLLVVAVLSMICGMGVMRLGESLAEQDLSAAALELAADLRWMQQVSVNSPVGAGGPFYSMVFDHATGDSYRVKAGLQVVKRTTLPASVRFANLPPEVTFSFTGAPSSGQTMMLGSSRLNKSRYVILAAVTGRVRVSDTPAWEAGE